VGVPQRADPAGDDVGIRTDFDACARETAELVEASGREVERGPAVARTTSAAFAKI
jgi:hypothetical protein